MNLDLSPYIRTNPGYSRIEAAKKNGDKIITNFKALLILSNLKYVSDFNMALSIFLILKNINNIKLTKIILLQEVQNIKNIYIIIC